MTRTGTSNFVLRDLGTGHRDVPSHNFDLTVTVIYTTREGTLAALKAAAVLAKDLNARLRLVATEIVPFRLPLDRPSVSFDFLTKRQEMLVSDAGIDAEEVGVEICLCRDPKLTLRQVLSPKSLLIFGGCRKWWPNRERRLGNFLSRLGHRVVFIPSDAKTSAPNLANGQVEPHARKQRSSL